MNKLTFTLNNQPHIKIWGYSNSSMRRTTRSGVIRGPRAFMQLELFGKSLFRKSGLPQVNGIPERLSGRNGNDHFFDEVINNMPDVV